MLLDIMVALVKECYYFGYNGCSVFVIVERCVGVYGIFY